MLSVRSLRALSGDVVPRIETCTHTCSLSLPPSPSLPRSCSLSLFPRVQALSRVSDDLEDILGECALQQRTDILAFYLGHYHNRVMCELSMFMHTAFAIGAGGLSLCERDAKRSRSGDSAFGSPDLLRLLDWMATYSRTFCAAKEAVLLQEKREAESEAGKMKDQAEGDEDAHTSALSAIAALPSRGRSGSARGSSGSALTKKKKTKLPEVELHLEHFIDLVARGYQAHVLAELAPIVLRIAQQSATVPSAGEYLLFSTDTFRANRAHNLTRSP